MARGSKQAYTDKQKRQAEHIEEGYEERGVGKEEAERRAWATVNKVSGGGKKSGSGRGKKPNSAPLKKGGNAAAPALARPRASGLEREGHRLAEHPRKPATAERTIP